MGLIHRCTAIASVQSRGATVQPPQSQPKTKTPREEDFETIKLISNGAYGYAVR